MALIVVIRNTTELAPVSDYEYTVAVTALDLSTGEVTQRRIAHGTVIGHLRTDGWEALVQRLLDQREDRDA